MARDKLEEITAIRERSGKTGWWRGRYKLDELVGMWTSRSEAAHIPKEFVVTRLVTILEVFTRDWVAQLIDSGEPYTSRGANLVKGSLKIDYAMAQALVGKQVSFGELVSHEISVNNIGDVDQSFSTLLGEKLFTKLAGVVDRRAISHGGETPAPILANPSQARAQMADLFTLRHIIVHELPNDLSVELEQIDSFVRATQSFVAAADQYFDTLLHGDRPLTQIDMNTWAQDKFDKVDTELKCILMELDPDGSNTALNTAQVAWEDYRVKQAEYRSSYVGIGSMAPMLYLDEMEKITRERIERLRWFLDREEGDM